MDGKMIAGIALIVGVVSIALLIAPIQAYVNGAGSGDMLQTQDREGLRTQNRDCIREQYRCKQRTSDCVTDGICNCTMSLKHCRNQTRERTRNLSP